MDKQEKYRSYIEVYCNSCNYLMRVRDDYVKKHSGYCMSCQKKGNKNAKTHGESNTRLFKIWSGLNYRRYSKHKPKRCDEWNDFLTFKEWSLKNGYNDDLTIDRIDSSKDYFPENCQWIPLKVNAGKDKIIFSDEEKIKIYKERKELNITQRQMAQKLGVSRNTIQRAEKFAKTKLL